MVEEAPREQRADGRIAEKLVDVVSIIHAVFLGHLLVQRVHVRHPGTLDQGYLGGELPGLEAGGQLHGDLLDVCVAVARAFLFGGVPLALRLVHRADVIEHDAFAGVRVVPEMVEDIDQVLRELTFEAGLEVGRTQALGGEGDPVARHASRRAVDERQELRDAAGLGGAQKPALARLMGPVVLAFGDLEGLGRTPPPILNRQQERPAPLVWENRRSATRSLEAWDQSPSFCMLQQSEAPKFSMIWCSTPGSMVSVRGCWPGKGQASSNAVSRNGAVLEIIAPYGAASSFPRSAPERRRRSLSGAAPEHRRAESDIIVL